MAAANIKANFEKTYPGYVYKRSSKTQVPLLFLFFSILFLVYSLCMTAKLDVSLTEFLFTEFKAPGDPGTCEEEAEKGP